MRVSEDIFRSYDVRGTYPDQINEDSMQHIGMALGTMLRRKDLKSCVVGRDNRESSPLLSASFIEGLKNTGCDVVDLGLCLTPMIHFFTSTKDFDCGAIITGSHNPIEFNGVRIDYNNARPFYGKELKELYALICKEDYEIGVGDVSHDDYFKLYLDFLKERFKFSRAVRVVLDCGNGTSSVFAPKIFEVLGCDVVPLYCDLDSDYPHGMPDPENKVFMGELEKNVVENNGEVGFAFDTDSDRLGVVDEKGNSYENDKLLLLFADRVLKDNVAATVVYDVKSTGLVDKVVKSLNGVPKMMRTGHPYFMEAIKQGAILGGEYSGHTYFGGEYFGYDDGIYAACKVLEILDGNQTLSQKMEVFPKMYHSSEIKISCPDDMKFGLVEKVFAQIVKDKNVKSVSGIDGARVQVTDTGWFLVRASNTSPYLTARVEGADRPEAIALIDGVKEILGQFDFLDLSTLDTAEIYES